MTADLLNMKYVVSTFIYIKHSLIIRVTRNSRKQISIYFSAVSGLMANVSDYDPGTSE